ncbi:hypothetical protein V12G01_13599 [Vibrio alginolyticus 12G01]|nr:hypothetical protein V12G01_13599 [Vibrio alginolyticus 12G01]
MVVTPWLQAVKPSKVMERRAAFFIIFTLIILFLIIWIQKKKDPITGPFL